MQSLIHYREIGMVTLTLYGFFSYQLYVSLETAVQLVFKGKASRPLGDHLWFSDRDCHPIGVARLFFQYFFGRG